LMQSNDLSKTSNQRQTLLEQQLRDLRLTSEKHQLSMQGEIDEYKNQFARQDSQINALQTANQLLKAEIKSLYADNEALTVMARKDKDLSEQLQQLLEQVREQHCMENEATQNDIELLQFELKEMSSTQQDYMSLKTSVTQLEKLCVKHQKSELEVKRQISVYKNFVNDLQREILELTERLAAGADEYKTLFRKYALLEHTAGINQQQEERSDPPVTTTATKVLTNEPTPNEDELYSLLRNAYENQTERQNDENGQENTAISTRTSLANIDAEVRQCPMCYWEFPQHITFDGKREHIEHHFAED
jgi:DNA repair exonuclease SbcCD ATPase subunit